ncbi:hypothetical protein HZA56_12630 [Candidatus Poribacteria bacterium]|nr:hypothetical protein [Candidatus Poribacteria bacterium]
MRALIAIDDTDNQESVGTGRLARMLADFLAEKGLVNKSSVTRHQLLVHPDIPYTSHNSCACIEAEILPYPPLANAKSEERPLVGRGIDGSPLQKTDVENSVEEIAAYSMAFLIENYHEGADPGLCVVDGAAVPAALPEFGFRAQREVIKTDDAKRLAEELGVFTWWSGEPWRGCIGAMAGVGLRSTENDGRFIGLDGIRELKGTLCVSEIIRSSRIRRVATASGQTLDDREIVDTQNWARPSLLQGEAVLVVVKHGDVWRPAEDKKGKP